MKQNYCKQFFSWFYLIYVKKYQDKLTTLAAAVCSDRTLLFVEA